MFLGTTALSEFWEKDHEILFLGSWCLRHDRRVEWEKLRLRVMPSPWKDRERFYEATAYLDQCYERLLAQLGDYLDDVHGVPHGRRYWRILLGPWCFHYLHVVYDRYVHLLDAFSKHPVKRTLVLDPSSFRVPRDTSEFQELVSDDPYNLQLFSQVLKAMGHSFPARQFREEWGELGNGRLKQGWASFPRKAITKSLALASSVLACAGSGQGSIGLWKSRLQYKHACRLALRTHLRVVPLELPARWPFPVPNAVFGGHRAGLADLQYHDNFERVAVELLPVNLPVMYLESYPSARESILMQARKAPETILCSDGWYFDEPFKFLAAELSDRKRRFVAVQHGGGYGIFRYIYSERHEMSVSDTFMVWGWADPSNSQMRNLPSPALSVLKGQEEARSLASRPTVFFISTANLRYLMRLHSFPVGIFNQEYIHWQMRFLGALPIELRRVLLFRGFPGKNGDEGRDRVTEQFKEIRVDKLSRIYKRIRQARLCVVDHAGTTFLEALRANVPTVLFWDSACTEVRQEAESYFENLRKAGILYESPEEAAAKVVKVYDEPWLWWGDPAVQAARRTFVDRLALGQRDWMDCWVKALEAEFVRRLGPRGTV